MGAETCRGEKGEKSATFGVWDNPDSKTVLHLDILKFHYNVSVSGRFI